MLSTKGSSKNVKKKMRARLPAYVKRRRKKFNDFESSKNVLGILKPNETLFAPKKTLRKLS